MGGGGGAGLGASDPDPNGLRFGNDGIDGIEGSSGIDGIEGSNEVKFIVFSKKSYYLNARGTRACSCSRAADC